MHINGSLKLKQSVNSVLCIALLCVITFWVALFYFTHRAFVLADTVNQSRQADISKNL